jgi:hypothetical protein
LLRNEHASHVSMKFIEFCWLMNIVSLCLSFYITHYLQFLDVDYFDSLNKAYRKQFKKKYIIKMMQINKLNFFAFRRKLKKEIIIELIIKSVWVKIDTILWTCEFISIRDTWRSVCVSAWISDEWNLNWWLVNDLCVMFIKYESCDQASYAWCSIMFNYTWCSIVSSYLDTY